MLKTYLATTVVASFTALGAYAQENPDAASHEDATLEEPAAPRALTGDEPVLPEASEATPDAKGPAPDAGGSRSLAGAATEVDVTTLSVDDLVGTSIQTADEQDVATVKDVILGSEGHAEHIVAEFGGLLGFGARTVLLTMEDIHVVKDPNDNLVVRTELTPEAIESRPDYEG
jgi:hypothetical protein